MLRQFPNLPRAWGRLFVHCVSRYNDEMKHSTSFRLTPEALATLKQLADSFGISQAAVLEIAIRQMAKAHDIKTQPR